MKGDRFDYIAVGPKGVYALCSDIPNDPDTRRFIADVLRRGHHVERIPVAEATRRHLEYLDALSPLHYPNRSRA